MAPILYRFENQLEKREALLIHTIEALVGEDHKRLKDEYDALKAELENKYNKCLVPT